MECARRGADCRLCRWLTAQAGCSRGGSLADPVCKRQHCRRRLLAGDGSRPAAGSLLGLPAQRRSVFVGCRTRAAADALYVGRRCAAAAGSTASTGASPLLANGSQPSVWRASLAALLLAACGSHRAGPSGPSRLPAPTGMQRCDRRQAPRMRRCRQQLQRLRRWMQQVHRVQALGAGVCCVAAVRCVVKSRPPGVAPSDQSTWVQPPAQRRHMNERRRRWQLEQVIRSFWGASLRQCCWYFVVGCALEAPRVRKLMERPAGSWRNGALGFHLAALSPRRTPLAVASQAVCRARRAAGCRRRRQAWTTESGEGAQWYWRNARGRGASFLAGGRWRQAGGPPALPGPALCWQGGTLAERARRARLC